MKVCLGWDVKISKYNSSSVTLMAESWTCIALDKNSAVTEEPSLPLSNTQQSNWANTTRSSLLLSITQPVPKQVMKLLDKGQRQAYLVSDQVREWKAFSSMSEWFLCKKKTTFIFTLLCISTALDLWWTLTYFKRCDTSPGYSSRAICIILAENFQQFPAVPCLWNFWSIISFSAPSWELHAAVLRLAKWHRHRISRVPMHHSNCQFMPQPWSSWIKPPHGQTSG